MFAVTFTQIFAVSNLYRRVMNVWQNEATKLFPYTSANVITECNQMKNLFQFRSDPQSISGSTVCVRIFKDISARSAASLQVHDYDSYAAAYSFVPPDLLNI